MGQRAGELCEREIGRAFAKSAPIQAKFPVFSRLSGNLDAEISSNRTASAATQSVSVGAVLACHISWSAWIVAQS